ncbi:MAG TPA: hypothetical protein PLP88_08140, partial [Bacteroidales bacterium]|nr:hypothetical protein [Bacteroidales bacterium]
RYGENGDLRQEGKTNLFNGAERTKAITRAKHLRFIAVETECSALAGKNYRPLHCFFSKIS